MNDIIDVHSGDIFQFPNGEYQYRVTEIFQISLGKSTEIELEQYLHGIYTGRTFIYWPSHRFFREQNRVYNEETREWKCDRVVPGTMQRMQGDKSQAWEWLKNNIRDHK